MRASQRSSPKYIIGIAHGIIMKKVINKGTKYLKQEKLFVNYL